MNTATKNRRFLFTANQKTLGIGLILSALLISALITINRTPPEQTALGKTLMNVDVIKVRLRDQPIQISAQGSVEPVNETPLIIQASGRIVAVSPAFVNGSFLNKGDMLIQLDDKNYRSALMQAKSQLASINTLAIKERGFATVAKKEVRRNKKKFKNQEAKDLYLHKPQLAEIEAKYHSAQADVTRAEQDLDNTIITAPYDGLIKNKQASFGLYVSAGTRIADILSVDKAEVRLSIALDKISYLNIPGDFILSNPAAPKEPDSSLDTSQTSDNNDTHTDGTISPLFSPVDIIASYGDTTQQWAAKLVRSENVLDNRNHSLNVIAEINNPYQRSKTGENTNRTPLYFGTFVDAKIEGKIIKNSIKLPRFALRSGNNIWIVDKDSRLYSRQVEFIYPAGDFVYVTAGLKENELVCLTLLGGVIPGTEVTVTLVNSLNIN